MTTLTAGTDFDSCVASVVSVLSAWMSTDFQIAVCGVGLEFPGHPSLPPDISPYFVSLSKNSSLAISITHRVNEQLIWLIDDCSLRSVSKLKTGRCTV